MHVVIVGGGFGGVKTALALAGQPNITVQLISQSTAFEYHGALYRSATGRSPLEVVIPLKRIFADAKNVEVVLDKITGLDAKKKQLVSETGTNYSYDKVVFGLGLLPNFFGIAGMEENAETMYTVAGTIKLRTRLVELFKSHQGKELDVAIIGAGASGVELSGDVKTFARMVAKRYKLKMPKIKVSIIEGMDRVLPIMLPTASKRALERLHRMKVRVLLNTRVNACEAGKVCLDAEKIKADVVVWTAGSRNHPFFEEYPEIFKLTPSRRVRVDEHLLAAPNIYVIGDNAATTYTGMAQTALHNALYVAEHILHQSVGRQLLPYEPKPPIYVVPIGPNWAVLQRGEDVTSGYSGWLVRRRADLEIFNNFQPFEEAIKTWRKGNRQAKY